MIAPTHETIEEVLIDIIEDLIQDWGLDLDNGVTGDTLLVNDLDFASVDIIQLCVAIEEYYNQKMGFQELLMKNGSYISDLSITQMVDFIGSRL
ncbi:MAG: acyl carrier protein [Thermodesulfobacteriota bacterium]|nr:acyl carrier protein [Thermodesulfobacteriota bacterium]